MSKPNFDVPGINFVFARLPTTKFIKARDVPAGCAFLYQHDVWVRCTVAPNCVLSLSEGMQLARPEVKYVPAVNLTKGTLGVFWEDGDVERISDATFTYNLPDRGSAGVFKDN